jgi:hypothetical protein
MNGVFCYFSMRRMEHGDFCYYEDLFFEMLGLMRTESLQDSRPQMRCLHRIIRDIRRLLAQYIFTRFISYDVVFKIFILCSYVGGFIFSFPELPVFFQSIAGPIPPLPQARFDLHLFSHETKQRVSESLDGTKSPTNILAAGCKAALKSSPTQSTSQRKSTIGWGQQQGERTAYISPLRLYQSSNLYIGLECTKRQIWRNTLDPEHWV